MVVNFKTTSETGKPFLNMHQIEALQRNMVEFENYLSDKYDFISKMDMLKTEKDTRQYFHLDVGQAIQVWNKVYREQ